jgi:hypothetical protein
MPSIHETAYPRLKAAVTTRDLAEVYTPTPNELELARQATRSATAQGCFVMLLKTFQRLDHFIRLRDVPLPIVRHIAEQLDVALQPQDLRAYDASGSRRRHTVVIRALSDFSPVGRSEVGEETCGGRLRGYHHFSEHGELMVPQLALPAGGRRATATHWQT